MALILFSDFIIPDKEAVKQEAASDDVLTDYESYVKEMEQRLKTTLEKIDGVGKADVMITAAGSGEYIYAKDEKVDTDSESVSKDEKDVYKRQFPYISIALFIPRFIRTPAISSRRDLS